MQIVEVRSKKQLNGLGQRKDSGDQHWSRLVQIGLSKLVQKGVQKGVQNLEYRKIDRLTGQCSNFGTSKKRRMIH